MVSFFVPGKPLAKGSVVAWKHPKTGAIIKRDQKAAELASWGGRVAAIALAAGVKLEPERPISLTLVFAFERPKSHYTKKGLRPSAPVWPTAKPDVDKVQRAALDSLTGIAYRDDSQVVRVVATKKYVDMFGPAPGVQFQVVVYSGELDAA